MTQVGLSVTMPSLLSHLTVLVFISSNKIPLVNFYGFSKHTSTTNDPFSFQGSFLLRLDPAGNSLSFQNLLFMPAALTYGTESGSENSESSTQLFRIFALTSELALYSALCIAHSSTDTKMLGILTTPPTIEARQRNRRVRSQKTAASSFIVPDLLDEENLSEVANSSSAKTRTRDDDFHLRMDWREIFKLVYPSITLKELQSRQQTPEEPQTMTHFINHLSTRLQDARDANNLPMGTL